MKLTRIFSAFLIFLALLFSCKKEITRGIDSYRNSTKKTESNLTAILEVNTPGFFLKNGQPTGYHYEMLREYARKNGLSLKVLPFSNLSESIDLINNGNADILAIESNSVANDKLQPTIPHWRARFATISASDELMSDRSTIYVPNAVFSDEEVKSLKKKYQNLKMVDPMNLGLIVENISHSSDSYAIVQSTMAEGIRIKYPNVKVQSIDGSVANSWYVSKNCNFLFDLNNWIATKRNKKSHSVFYSSFYQNTKVNRQLVSGASMQGEITLSKYDDMVKQYSARIGWDWLLVSALICQESKFNSDVESAKGAKGLMQVMPATANLFGFESEHSTSSNLYIGTKLLSRLTKAFSKYPIPEGEREKFVLGAYNGGIGHVIDAMKLARKHGRDPYSWDDVAYYLKMKRNPAYYNDPVSKFGIFYDNETTKFVVDVLDRYESYKVLTLNGGI